MSLSEAEEEGVAVMAGRRVDMDSKCTWDMLSLRCL